ncbi:HAMP domain-containing sensor histidine kinase [Sporomusa sp.]|uniref:sensor histidine kinase n=1 Tax=Sporomusa sp. TaxID=2078658 RepID=UPI002B81BDEB|nr:HAMP domain-containing sensor histidine kinase [Sporomusa sp.]HWR05930.1 HAMP domain-containing sensor histidine kinase [Sporomusa sp.]
MGHGNVEGAILVLFFFAIAVAMPLSGFLFGKQNSSVFFTLSWLAFCTGVQLFAQLEIRQVFIAVPLFWDNVTLFATCLLPAAFYRLLEQCVCHYRHIWLERFVRLHVVYAVAALLGLSANIVATGGVDLVFAGITAGTGLVAGGVVVYKAVYGNSAARTIVTGLIVVAVLLGTSLLLKGGGVVWPMLYTVHWGFGIMILTFLLLLRHQLYEENVSSRRVLARTWRTLSGPGIGGKESLAVQAPGAALPVEPLPAAGSPCQSSGVAVSPDKIARFAHEINSPLGTGIMAASYLGQEVESLTLLFKQGAVKKSDLEKHLNLYSESADSILANLQTAAEIVSDFRKSVAGSERRQVFSVKAQAKQVLLALKPRLTQAGHQIQLVCGADFSINGFPGLFTQIITNLVLNSLIHGYDQGDQGSIVLKISKEEQVAVLEYSDDGKGICEDTLAHIFDPYFTTNREQGSSGLGLSIVKEIITAKFGGTIDCHSTEGKGVIFTIRFPIGELKQ